MEPSEIMTANALRWSNSTTNKLSSISEYKQLTDLIDDAAAYHKKIILIVAKFSLLILKHKIKLEKH